MRASTRCWALGSRLLHMPHKGNEQRGWSWWCGGPAGTGVLRGMGMGDRVRSNLGGRMDRHWGSTGGGESCCAMAWEE